MLVRIACLTLVAWFFAHVPIVSAQDVDGGNGWAGQWVFMAGWQRVDVEGLNARLSTNGFPAFPADVLSLGGGGWAFKDDFVIGGNGHALISEAQTTTGGGFRATLSGGYGQADVGYRLFTSERVDVYPIIGFGAGATTLEIVEQGTATFDEILGDPRTMTRLTTWGYLFDVAAVTDVRVTGRVAAEESDEDTRGGLSLGIRVGYAFWPGDWEWDVPGGPAYAVRGAYVRVMVGGWLR